MLIHLCKAQILNRFLAQCSQHFRLADFAGTKLLEQHSCLIWGHAEVYEELPDFLQQKCQKLTDGHTGLLHGVSIPEGHGVLIG